MIKVGEKLPAGTLREFIEVATEGCSVGPNEVDVAAATAGKTIALFALPGAFTPTCSAQHVPGYRDHAEQLKAAGVDEIWCVSVNDAFVMSAWGQSQNAEALVMAADGNGEFTQAMGLTLDGSGFGLGHRSSRYALIAEDGKITTLNAEQGGAFEVSSAEKILEAL